MLTENLPENLIKYFLAKIVIMAMLTIRFVLRQKWPRTLLQIVSDLTRRMRVVEKRLVTVEAHKEELKLGLLIKIIYPC